METKECKKCLAVKPVNEFHKDKGMKDGRKNYCKECYKAKIYSYGEKEGEEKRKPYISVETGEPASRKYSYTKKGYSKTAGFLKLPKPIIIKDEIEGKECNCCEKWQPLTNYHKFRRMSDGLEIYCKDCRKKKLSDYFQTEKGKNNAHKASAKRRAKKKGVKFTPYERSIILKRDKYTCQKCKIKVHDRSIGNWNTPDKAHVDHIVSLEDGGTWDYENLQILCRTCNLEKGAKSEGVVQLALF